MSRSTDNDITFRSLFWISCETYLLVFFLSHSARQGSSLARSFISCMKFESVLLSPCSANPCLAKNLRLEITFRRHSRFYFFVVVVNARMKAFLLHQGKNKVEQLTSQLLPLVTIWWSMLFESDCCVFPVWKSFLCEWWVGSLGSHFFSCSDFTHRWQKTTSFSTS